MEMSNHWVEDRVVAGAAQELLDPLVQFPVGGLPRAWRTVVIRPALSTITRLSGCGRSSAMTSHATLRAAT